MGTDNMLRHVGSGSSSGVSMGDITDQNSQHINEAALSTSLLSMDTNTTSSNKQHQRCKIIKCSFYLVLGGTILGLTLPKNPNFPSQSWQLLSNIIGYTYFLAWSLSFYPQIYLNYQRKTTQGLSVDFCCLNVLGYVCYTIYTTNFYFNENVINAYKDKMSISSDDTTTQRKGEITVTGNDVAFAIHAIIMASVTLAQVGFYDTFTARPASRRVYIILFCAALFCLLYVLGTWLYQGQVDILGFLYVLGSIKICVTIGKYVPQALMNRSRKSTVGWNVWNVILDLTGGVLSLLQLIGDCWAMNDWSGLFGNPAKMLLSLVTITFDGIFLVQHYILYPENEENESSPYSPLPAIESIDMK